MTTAFASSKPAIGEPSCNSMFNPYSYSRKIVSACGYESSPRIATKPLPGGGNAYIYMQNGHKVTFLVPPKGFQPITATAAQLTEYGLPARPKGKADLARWEKEMRRAKPVTPPPFLAESHSRAYSTYSSNNWSGYVATGSTGAFHQAEAWYWEPTYYSSSCSTNAAVVWAGIGGYLNNTGGLGQDGTAHGVPGLANHQAWYEVVPDNDITPIGVYASNTDYMDMSTTWDPGPSYYAFFEEDITTGAYESFRFNTSDRDTRTAEMIVERPKINGSFSNLSNFQIMTFNKTQANGSGLNNFSSLRLLDMYDSSGVLMSEPAPIESSPGGYFTVTQHHCS
jgi:Peptidase A4 family